MSLKPFDIACVQMAPAATKAESLEKAAGLVADSAAKGAQVVCLPELFATPYFCQVEDAALFDLAEPLDGPTVTVMAHAAKKTRTTVLASFFEKRAPGLYHNTLAVLGPDGETLGVYRKMHIPDDPSYYEKFYFTPGDMGFKAVPTPVGPVGTLVCWDQWYPEAARLTALSGALVIFYPTAIGWLPQDKEQYGADQREAWITIQRSHAIANGVFVAAVNRVGTESCAASGGTLEFWGSSFVAGPHGQIRAMGSTDKEEILIATVDPAEMEATRRGWPFLRDRRIDAYDGLLKRYLA